VGVVSGITRHPAVHVVFFGTISLSEVRPARPGREGSKVPAYGARRNSPTLLERMRKCIES